MALLLILSPWLGFGARIGLVAGAIGGYGLLLFEIARRSRVPRALVVGGIAVLLALAVMAPPRESGDLWAYAMYGRIVTVHHANPYRANPAEFAHDPLLHRDAHRERYLYGPAFLGLNAAAAPIVGTSALRIRIFYQLLAALAVALALLLVWRRTRDVVALAFLGLNPVVVLEVVNGGHNDALVGLAVLGATLCAERRRWKAAGVLLGLGVLVKIWALVAALGVLVFLWRRGHRIGAAVVTCTAAAFVALGYLVAGGPSAFRPLVAARDRVSSASPWKLPAHLGLDSPGVGWITGTVVLVVIICLMSPRLRTAAGAACGALGGYLLVAPYVLAWYPGAVLPVAALERRRAAALILALQSTLLVAWYQVLLHAPPSSEAVATTRWLAPAATLVLLGACLLALQLRRRPQMSVPSLRARTEVRG